MPERELDDVIERFRDALRMYVKGDPEPAADFFSTRDDVTLANPLGPPRRGPADVRDGTIQGGAFFKEGGERHPQDLVMAPSRAPIGPSVSMSKSSHRSSRTSAGKGRASES